jgi:hypothetical protein
MYLNYFANIREHGDIIYIYIFFLHPVICNIEVLGPPTKRRSKLNFNNINQEKIKVKAKAIPVTGCGGP